MTVHQPISSVDGDLELALYGSFLPIPSSDKFPVPEEAAYATEAQPGAIVPVSQGDAATIVMNEGRERIKLRVTNKGDRPIQVGSHYHFIETNPALDFDRAQSYGKRLDIAAGTAIRFEPGVTKTVTLVPIGGRLSISGGNNLASGPLSAARLENIVSKLVSLGFSHTPAAPLPTEGLKPFSMSRADYVQMFGPTTGDLVRLGDTDLWVQVEADMTTYGDECTFGGGKAIRDGMGQASGRSASECLDCAIVNALIIDYTGIYKVNEMQGENER